MEYQFPTTDQICMADLEVFQFPTFKSDLADGSIFLCAPFCLNDKLRSIG